MTKCARIEAGGNRPGQTMVAYKGSKEKNGSHYQGGFQHTFYSLFLILGSNFFPLSSFRVHYSYYNSAKR